MKRGFAALLAALMLGLWAPCAAEQTGISVFVSADSVPGEAAKQLVQLLQRAIPEAAFTLTDEAETGVSLRELVMRDEAPQIALCTAQAAAAWAGEGLLLPLDTSLGDTQGVEAAVLDACMRDGKAFMAPLTAHHRRMAVNADAIRALGMGYLLDARAYPVWLPMQLAQVLEEAALCGEPAMDLWLPTPQACAGVLAMAQAIHGGRLLTEDGKLCTAESPAGQGLAWLGDMAACGLIGIADSRAAALQRFLDGKTALFIDWTQAEDELLRAKGGAEAVKTMPYPSSLGLPVRAIEPVGAVVFAAGDQRMDALARAAVAVLTGDVQAQQVLGGRAILADGALWMADAGPGRDGAARCGAMCAAAAGVLAGDMDIQTALRAADAALSGR